MRERPFAWMLLAGSYVLFFGTWYCVFWSKVFPPAASTHLLYPLQQRVSADRHYCLVVPWTGTVGVLFFAFGAWMGMKLFRHN